MLAGLDAHCASVRACGLGTAEVDADPAGAVEAIVEEAARAIAGDGGGDLGETRRAGRRRRGCRGRACSGVGRPRAEHQQGGGLRGRPQEPAQPLAAVGSAGTRFMNGYNGCQPNVEGIDLASRALGGRVIAASDDTFGYKKRLIDASEPAFVGMYDLRGEVVDGWETRRHAGPDGDWVIVRLGVAGRLRAVDVDTRFFTGHHPPACRIAACSLGAAQD